MDYRKEYFFCSPKLLKNVEEIDEIEACIYSVKWAEEFIYIEDGIEIKHQAAYNKAFDKEFLKYGWKLQPILYNETPRLIGDYAKNDVFVEVQFGNTATIFRDYYKFYFGLTHNLLSLAVLIVPTNPRTFFPARKKSVSNMAEFDFACKYFKLLPIPVPILVIGLKACN